MMVDSTVTSKGQVTIPKEIREFLHLDAGNKVRFITRKDGTCTLIPMKTKLSDIFGMLPAPKKAVSVEEMNEAVKKTVAKRYLENDSD